MSTSCIITDNSIQLATPGFHGLQNLNILPHRIYNSGKKEIDLFSLKVSEFPRFVSAKFSPKIESPGTEYISNLLMEELSTYDDIFIILLSKDISNLYEKTETICNTLHGHANLHLIDSQNTSLGLGLIVQYAAELIASGHPAAEIEKSLRLIIPHVYTLLCTPNLTYLQAAGLLDKGQAIIGEMLSLFPLFLIEDGVLNPIQKVKNQHNAAEYFIEFVDEFDDLKHVAIIQPSYPGIPEARLLHQHLDECFPFCNYSEHPISPFLASLIGPRGFGMVVMEKM